MITVPLEDVIHDVKSGYASGERSLSGIVQVRMNNVSTDGHLSLDEHIRVPATVKLYSAFESGPTAAGESGPIPGRRRRSPHESLW